MSDFNNPELHKEVEAARALQINKRDDLLTAHWQQQQQRSNFDGQLSTLVESASEVAQSLTHKTDLVLYRRLSFGRFSSRLIMKSEDAIEAGWEVISASGYIRHNRDMDASPASNGLLLGQSGSLHVYRVMQPRDGGGQYGGVGVAVLSPVTQDTTFESVVSANAFELLEANKVIKRLARLAVQSSSFDARRG